MLTEREKILERLWLQASVRADELLEAAEFEARVAARLAISLEALGFYGLEDELLKLARLSVEEEMDADERRMEGNAAGK